MANQIKYQVGFDVKQSDLNKLKASLQDLQKMKIGDIMKINDTDAASATSMLNEIKKQALNVEDALKKAFNTKLNTTNITEFNDVLQKSGSNIEQVYSAWSKAGTAGENAFRTLSSQVLSTNIQLKETHNILDKMARTLTNTVKWNVASGVVNELSRSVEQAWGYVKALDTSLNDIRIVTGKSADEMANFAVQANNAAKELGKTTTDYTNAALIYAQQGLNDKEIAERAAITLKAANVTGQSTDDVSEQLTAVWNGYKVTAEEAELYVDRLAAVAATTASDLEELSTGMSKVASAAAAMGVGQDQLAAQLSTIISVTKQAPESVGTALRTVYARISDIKAGIDEDGVTLGKYSGAMADLGFNVLDATGHLRDMGEVMEEIGNSWQDLTREQQISLAQTMAGQRQYNNLLALFDNFEEYNKALNTAQNAAGTLQEQQDIYMESTAAHLQVLKASVEDIYDSFADTDTINGLIDGLSTAAVFAADLIDSLGGGGAVLSSLGAIGVTVFSEQIAKGLNTTITNLEISKENARQFDQALQATKEWQGIPGLEEVSQNLLKDREQLLELARLMSPEQFTGMQTLLNEITETGNELASLNDKQGFLKSATEEVLTAKDQWQSFNDILKDESGQQAVIDRIQEQENAFRQVKDVLNDYLNNLKALNQQTLKGKDVSSQLTESKQELEQYANKLQEMVDKGELERHRDQVTRLKQELEQLDDSLPAQEMASKLQLIGGQLHGIASNATTTATNLRINLENEFAQTADSLETQIDNINQKLKGMESQFDNEINKVSNAVTIEKYAKMAGGIASVGAAISQLQNLGSIWKNEDLTVGEKLLQTITNLSISLPMLITGFTKATTAMNLMKIATYDNATAAATAMTANGAHAVSLGAVGIAAEGATTKVQILNTVLELNPFIKVAAGVIALVTALGFVIKALDETNESLIKQNQATIDEQNQTQQLVEKNKQLYNSIEELNKQYEDGQITRSELKTEVESLIEKYELQKETADKLTGSYNNLGQAIRNARGEAAQKGLQSAEKEKGSADEQVLNTARGKVFDNGQKVGNEYQLRFNSIKSQNQQIIKAMRQAGGTFDNLEMAGSFTTDYDTDSIIALYSRIETAVKNIKATVSDADRANSTYFQDMTGWLEKMKTPIQQYKAAVQDVAKYSTELAAITAMGTGSVDLSNIENANQYLEQRLALIQEIQAMLDEKGDTTSDASAMTDAYLRDNFKELYAQYSEGADYIQQIREKFGDTNKDIEQMISDLDGDHLGILMGLDQSTIRDWGELADIIQRVANIDLNNVTSLVDGDPGAMLEAASDKYNIYQSLEDQVRGGKSISKKEVESLDPELQKYFDMMANGTFKMTGDAEEFYDKVNSLKLDGFFDTLDAVNRELDKSKALQAKNFNYEELDQQAYKFAQVDPIDYDLVKQQLDYLQIVTDTNDKLNIQIDQWAKLAEDQALSKEHVDAIAEAIGNAGDQTKNLEENQKELEATAKEVAHQLHDAMFPTDADIDTKALDSLTKVIQDIADKSDDLADSLTKDSRAAEDVAESILRFDNAIEDVVKNYQDWMDALNNGSIQEQAEIIDGLRDAYADLLDLDGSSLSNDFLTSTKNLDLMKAAIDGNTEAYDELLARAGQDIVSHMDLDHAQFDADLAVVQSELDAMSYQDLEIGANLDTGNFISACQNLINNAHMTAQQATDYLASMGVDAEVIEQDTSAEEASEAVEWHSTLSPNTHVITDQVLSTAGSTPSPIDVTQRVTSWDQTVTSVPVTDSATKENKSFSLKVTSAHKSSGGGFKFSQAKNGGGSKGAARRGGGGKKGKGGGGGKGKASEPDKSQKDTKKPMEDTRDIYHDINIELGQIDRKLDRVQKKQDRLYGKQLLNNLNRQSKILEQHKTKLKEKNELQKQDLKAQRSALKNLGVTFDKYGNISNYMTILAKKQEQVNAKTKEYNRLIEQYNKSTDKEAKKQIADEAEKLNKKIKEFEDEYKELENKIKSYDDLREDMADLVDQIEEETQQQIEIKIQKFRMAVEIRLELGEAERDWNKFRREVLEHTDIIKDTEFQEIFSDVTQSMRDITSYFNVRGSKGSLQTLTEQLNNTRKEIEAIDKTGKSAIYGDNKAQAMEDLQNDLEELTEQMEDIQGLVDDIDEAYLDTIDDIEEQFDKQIEDYEYVGDLIEHDIDLLSLLYGDKNYDAMNKYYETLERNNLKQLDSLKQQRDFWKEQWDEAVARGDTQAAKQFEENYKNTIQNLNEAIEEAAKTIQDKYINAIDKIFDELDKKISNNKGTDYLNTEWQLMNKNADEYLDTINTAFAIQETERKYQKALDETKSIKNQQALKKLMDEQLTILRNKEKVTQYDVDRAEKLLQVEQARIALEDAQSAKTSMRLKRDSQGNYSYEYVADNNAVDEAQGNLAKARNDLYNFDKERYQSNLNDMLSAWKEFQSEYKDILEDSSITEQERIERLALLRQQYSQYINDKTAENLVVRKNLMESAFDDLAMLYNEDVENYNQMSIDEKNILMGDLVPAWESGIQQMSDKVAGEGGFIPTCQDAFDNLTEATQKYKNELEDMTKTAEVNLTDVKNGVDNLSDSFEKLIENNSELTDRIYDEMKAISSLRAEVRALAEEYREVYEAAKVAAESTHDFVQDQETQAAQAASKPEPVEIPDVVPAPITAFKGNPSVINKTKTTNKNTSKTKEKGEPVGIAITSLPSITKLGTTIASYVNTIDDFQLKKLIGFSTGGYTGDWDNDNGRLALLHKKEIVLNQDDTKNLLDSVNIIRSIISNLNGNMFARLGDIRNNITNPAMSLNEGIEQNVHIDATFPNVNSKREIEEAFNDLVNLATQRAMRR